MKTLADLKRRIKVGTELTLTDCDKPHKYLNVRRRVTHAQSNSFASKPIDAEEGAPSSWLDYGKAKDYTFYPDQPNHFTVEGFCRLTYMIHEEPTNG